MIKILKYASLFGALVAFAPTAYAEDARYPFIGAWDCEVATFTFTPGTWNNGSEDLPIQEVQEGSDGGSWTLLFAGDYYFTVSDFNDDTMSWLSGESGDNFTCTRLPE